MITRLVVGAVSVITFSVAASAADIYVPAPSGPSYKDEPWGVSWTGFYIGANGGYGWGSKTVTLSPNDPATYDSTCGGVLGGTCPGPTSLGGAGGLGGLQIGYNRQFNQSVVLGLEADFDWSRIKNSGYSGFALAPIPVTMQTQAQADLNWSGTIRGRLGWLVTHDFLVYGTGGFAYGRIDDALNIVNPTPNFFSVGTGGSGYTCLSNSSCFAGGSSRIATGWAAGAGVEYAPWNNVSIKLEYLHIDLGGDSLTVPVRVPFPPFLPSSFTAHSGDSGYEVVRIGVNYHISPTYEALK